MSTETHHYYGFSLTEDYSRLQRDFKEALGEDTDLADCVEENRLGHSHYDGGGYGQVTYIGVDVPMTADGIVVTTEIKAEAAAIMARLPDEFREVLIEFYGGLPEPRFDYEQSDG